jgi:hypothetical protein
VRCVQEGRVEAVYWCAVVAEAPGDLDYGADVAGGCSVEFGGLVRIDLLVWAGA